MTGLIFSQSFPMRFAFKPNHGPKSKRPLEKYCYAPLRIVPVEEGYQQIR
jgi:hypothetical protein